MAAIAYCPQCGHLIWNDNELDLKDYERSQCRFCGFSGGLPKVPDEYKYMSLIDGIKFDKKLKTDEYFGRKLGSWEQSHMNAVKCYSIDKNPLYNKELSIRSATLWEEERQAEIKAKDDARHKQEMDKLWDQVHQSMASKPHCPTCGSTNVKKLDVVDRAVSVGTLGVLSNKINKSFKCKDCGYTW